MTSREHRTLRGVVMDVEVTYNLAEFCQACGVRSDLVVEMVQEGVIEPTGPAGNNWCFHGATLVRARRALRLVNDLGVNWPGAALALDLLDQLDALRRR